MNWAKAIKSRFIKTHSFPLEKKVKPLCKSKIARIAIKFDCRNALITAAGIRERRGWRSEVLLLWKPKLNQFYEVLLRDITLKCDLFLVCVCSNKSSILLHFITLAHLMVP